MRITPELLLKLANDFVAQRCRADRDIIAVYLQGSLLREQPTIAGTTDIDLFFLHADSVREEREFVPITDEIHYDIAHHPASLYRRAKELRSNPWLGTAIEGCKIFYDPQHFLDFTQASVRGQFFRADHVLSRARPQAEHAREIWMGFKAEPSKSSPKDVLTYLRALDHSANSIACLSGAPLTERRFLMDFPERAAAVKHPGLYAGLLGLLGTPLVDSAKVRSWLVDWRSAYDEVASSYPRQRLHPYRLNYYLKAFEAMLDAERFQIVLWPLWRTWTHALNLLSPRSPHLVAWQSAGESLGMLGKAFQERLSALDAFLDLIDETLEIWVKENGA